MKFLVFKHNHLGDNIVFLPGVQALYKRFRDWQLTIITTPEEKVLYENLTPAPHLLTSPQTRFNSCWRRPWELAGWWTRVSSLEADACLVSFDSGNVAHLLARHSGATLRVGSALPAIRVRHSLTHNIPLPASGWVVEWNWAIARTLAKEAGGIELSAKPPPPNLSHLLTGLTKPSARPLVIVHAGASSHITRWPMDRFAVVAARLARDHDVVWIDRPETAAATLAPTIRRYKPKSLRAFATLLAGADLFLGNNSGPMHLANALGRRGVVVTGSTARGWDPYWHRERWTVLRHPALSCQPCEQVAKKTTACANTASPFACLQYWSAEAVETACRAALACPPFPPK